MVLFNKKSDQNIHQNAPDCIHHFKIFSGSMPPNSLACVQLILFLYEGSHFYSEFFQNIYKNFFGSQIHHTLIKIYTKTHQTDNYFYTKNLK